VPIEEECQHVEVDNELTAKVKMKNILNILLPYPCGEPLPKMPHARDLVTFDAEVEAVASAQIHPTWSVKTTWLQTAVLDTEEAGGKGRKWYDWFPEARGDKQLVISQTLHQRGMSAYFQCISPFRASAAWVQGIKKKLISDREAWRNIISSKDNASCWIV
jgi:hypothetical protein